MKEASITLPIGHPKVADWLERALVQDFGGVTVLHGAGAWENAQGILEREDIQRFTVAVPESPTSNSKVETIARIAGGAADQQAMYVTLADGTAEILDIPHSIQRAA